jgi:alcohol dehydrogenase
MRSTWNFSSAGRLLFGRGAVDELGPAVRRLDVERVLVITDEPLVAAGAVDRVRSALLGSGLTVEVFTGGEPEPSLDAARNAIAHAATFAPDAILGLGGGSNIDLAKMTAIVHTHGGDPRDYFGWDNVPGPTCPMIAVATTAGTGSEVSASAVLTDAANEVKVSTLSPHIRPALGVVDPLLTVTCPPKPTADSGIDALTHAIEAYLATNSSDLAVPPGELGPYEGKNPMADLVAERAITLIGQHLEITVAQPENLEAREAMALAATLGGLAFSNAGVALVHAMEYPLGGRLHCSHGAGNGLLLPYVMRFNLPVREAEIARIAELLGEDVRGCSQQEAAERGIVAVERLRAAIGIPTRIREFGGTADQLPDLAAKAFAIKRLLAMTPREPTEADILALFQEAL